MELYQCILTKNDCYKKHTPMTPKGIVVHSTGANNPYLKRYVQPDDGYLGVNTNNNSWNRPGLDVCVHAFIGYDKDNNVKCYQTLPFDIACWGIGQGSKGSFNYDPTGHIQFEICEDDLTNEDYFNKCFDLAAEFCAYLCEQYNLSVDSIVGHHEAYLLGYGSNHSDPENWTKKFGKDMNWFRELVKTKLQPEPTPEPPKPEPTPEPSNIKVGDWVVPTRLVNYTGTPLIQYDDKYKVIELVGDRAVLEARGQIWAAMNVNDIKKVD